MKKYYLHSKKGITLVALVITIIILIILAAVSINTLWGENGIITEAQEVAFRAEMVSLKEQVKIVVTECEMDEISIAAEFERVSLQETEKWDIDLKKEIIYWGQYDIGVTEITKEYAKNYWEDILNTQGVLDNLYYVDEETAGGKNKTYLYDAKVDIVYKIPITRIGKYAVHSIEELDDSQGIAVTEKLITDESEFVNAGGISHYEPDLSGFALEKTSIVYYKENVDIEGSVSDSIIVSAEEYIANGKQRTIENAGEKYVFYNYEEQQWANILVENSGMKSYWVWIPRYSYKTDDISDIRFIDLESTPEEGHIIHSCFDDGKKGVWVSKYEPIQTANVTVSNFPYYIPDMTGFNENNTYIEVYNSQTESFEETKLKDIGNLTDFAKENKWFDYTNQIWANIRIIEPESGAESWWVWVPRYAYNITGNETSIIFIDTNDNPLDGSRLPSNYIVHPAFEDEKKGIWASKYEPVLKVSQVGATNNVNPPNMKGFNVDNTYIECYDATSNTFTEQTLRSILSDKAVINSDNVLEQMDIDYSKINGTWYRYDKQIWANIKVVEPENDVESWWVWIPRYAYNITGIETTIIYLDSEGNPLDGSKLPSNYIPHPAFNEAPEGIWASKYEPIEK